MFKGRSVAVVVTAAGSGKRMGAPVPKQFLKLNNETILEQAVGKFRHVDAVDRIVIVVPADYTEKCRALFSVGSESEDGRGRRSTDVISGGAERQDSVCAALDALAGSGFSGEDIVLIHDGVRPFVDTEIIENVIRQTASPARQLPRYRSEIPSGTVLGERWTEAGCTMFRHRRDFGFLSSERRLIKRIGTASMERMKQGSRSGSASCRRL